MKGNGPTKIQAEGDEESRSRQILVGGLDTEEDEEQVIKFINEEITKLGGKEKLKILNVTTYLNYDPAKFGIIEFKTVGAKISFFQKVKKINIYRTRFDIFVE